MTTVRGDRGLGGLIRRKVVMPQVDSVVLVTPAVVVPYGLTPRGKQNDARLSVVMKTIRCDRGLGGLVRRVSVAPQVDAAVIVVPAVVVPDGLAARGE